MKWVGCLLLVVLWMGVCEGGGSVFLTLHSMCKAKPTCESCLRMPQCAWCPGRSDGGPRCFPVVLRDKVDCDDLLTFKDHGLSLARSAECTCARGSLPSAECVAPGGGDVQCSGRGTCTCGRCVCQKMPEPNEIVSGKYCECDNFSCVGQVGVDCTEGPYCRAFDTTATAALDEISAAIL